MGIETYSDVVRRVEEMVQDREARALARTHGLEILNVTWEDTGRFKDSAVGPNISDMTIQVQPRSRAPNRLGRRACP